MTAKDLDLYRNLLLLVEEKVFRYLAVVLLGISILRSSGANGTVGLLNSVTALGLLALSMAVHLWVSIRVHRTNQPVRLWPLSPHAVLATGIGIGSIASGWLQAAIGAILPMPLIAALTLGTVLSDGPVATHAAVATGNIVRLLTNAWPPPGIGIGSAYAMVAMLVIGSVTNFAIRAASSARS